MPGAISLPSYEQENGGIKKNLNQARAWFNKKWNGEDNSESTPLLGDDEAAPRKSKFRIIVTITAVVVALIALGAIIGLWVNRHHNKKSSKGFCLFFMRVTKSY